MKQRILVLIMALLALSSLRVDAQTETQETPPGVPQLTTRLLSYYSYYNIYEQAGTFLVTDVPVERLTHLHYASVGISATGQCESVDEYADTEYLYPGDRTAERLRGNFKQLPILRQRNPELQIIMSVGGWENSGRFSDAALTDESRTRFVQSCIAFMRQYSFDGIEIDWRYPVEGGRAGNITRPEDTANLTLLMQALRAGLEETSLDDDRRYLLTMTLPAVEGLYRLYDVAALHPLLDYINLMTFDFEGAWSSLAAHIAPLYSSERDPRGVAQTPVSVDGAVTAYLNMGVPADKLVIGVPFYAQAWQNVRAGRLFGLYQATGGVPSGTRADGRLYYRDLNPLLTSADYVRYFDDMALASWMYNARRNIAVSYESPESARAKGSYARTAGLGGVMAWEVSFDAPTFDLLNAIYQGLTQP